MADNKKIAFAIVASSLALLGNSAQAEEDALSYSDLGTAEEVLSNLVSDADKKSPAPKAKMDGDQTNKKPGEGKCGESKCGDGDGKGKGDPNFPIPQSTNKTPNPMMPERPN